MKVLRLAAPVLALALLAGCQQPAVESPSPVPSPDAPPAPSYQVTTHWDALNERPTPLVQRRYEGYTDDLIPADDYGQLVPYIGGEASAQGWGTGWYYGLATRDGVIVTDPVFLEIEALSYYDSGARATRQAPLLILRQGGVNEDADPGDSGYYYNRYGLAAMDGAWYTGLAYSALICQSELGALMFETGGDVVMIGLDGHELWRWGADEIPLPNLTPQESYWGDASASGPYLNYVEHWDDEGQPSYLYVDLRTGQVLDSEPSDYPADLLYQDGMGYFNGGWYKQADGTLTIHTDDGRDYSFALPEGCDYPDINGDRVIFRPSTYTAGENQVRSIVTDLEGNVLLRSDQYLNFIWQSWGDVSSLLYCSDFHDDGSGTSWTVSTVLDRDGNELFTTREYPQQFGDRLLWADDAYYHLTDLEGTDLIRFPRWSSLDLPADD